MKPSERIEQIRGELREQFRKDWPYAPVPDHEASAIVVYLDEQHEERERTVLRVHKSPVTLSLDVTGLDADRAHRVANAVQRALREALEDPSLGR